MRLEGTLDAFSLPDIFQLLSFTKKTGTLHLHRERSHGVVHLRDGAVVGARAEATRQELGRRIVGTGLVDDDALERAAGSLQEGVGLARALVDGRAIDPALARDLAIEHITDAVFDLLRWPDGEFSFVVDEPNPDDLGASLLVEDVVAEANRRLELWPGITESVPAPDAVVQLIPMPAEEPVLSRDEWALLAMVDGRRTVAELVLVAGRGEYAVVSAIGTLVQRGLLQVVLEASAVLERRQDVLARVEGSSPPARP
ncbi:MAG TPA: DUF4388 domain-containing protein, partial [Mycobacteriales bacterium]|nr:DUF4388 domain-containing protein [Mycobacteriales bacterium]